MINVICGIDYKCCKSVGIGKSKRAEKVIKYYQDGGNEMVS